MMVLKFDNEVVVLTLRIGHTLVRCNILIHPNLICVCPWGCIAPTQREHAGIGQVFTFVCVEWWNVTPGLENYEPQK